MKVYTETLICASPPTDIWANIFSGVSAFAALVTVIIAIYAITSWKREHLGKEQMKVAALVRSKLSRLEGYTRLLETIIKQNTSSGLLSKEKIASFNYLANELEIDLRQDIALYLGEIVERNIIDIRCQFGGIITDVEYANNNNEWNFTDEDTKTPARLIKKIEHTQKMIARHIKDLNYQYTASEKQEYEERIKGTINERRRHE